MKANTQAIIDEGKHAIAKLERMKERQKIAQAKYYKTEKGKAALARANKKYYKPTGKPRGRPKKHLEQTSS